MTPVMNAGTTGTVWGHEHRESGSMRESEDIPQLLCQVHDRVRRGLHHETVSSPPPRPSWRTR